MIPPLCILQMRLASTRLPNKMLLKLGGETLAARGWRVASGIFGPEHCVVATPQNAGNLPLWAELKGVGARVFLWDGPENDLLGRFYDCAHTYRWKPESVIVRWTPDDPFKDAASCKRVIAGERLPVEQGAEAFTLAQLDAAYRRSAGTVRECEHLTDALFPVLPPKSPEGIWTVDTPADYELAKKRAANEKR